MHPFPTTKGIRRQGRLVALHHTVAPRRGRHPEISLFVADAAVALARGLDLGGLELVHEGGAVAVAAVGLEGRFDCLGHGSCV